MRDAGCGAMAEFTGKRHRGKGQRTLKMEPVVFLMAADPKPIVLAVALSGQGAIAATDFDSVHSAFLAET